MRGPLVGAVMFVFGWEPLTRIVPGYVDFLTIKKHLLALWPSLAMGERPGAVEVGRRVIDVGVGEALFALLLVTTAFAVATTVTLRRKEFVRGQTLG